MSKKGRLKRGNTKRIDITLPVHILKVIDEIKEERKDKSTSRVISNILQTDLTLKDPETLKQFLILCNRVETIQKAVEDIKKASWLGRGKRVDMSKDYYEKLIRKVIREIK